MPKREVLKLYVWEDVNRDYTCGVMFALAHSEEEARELIAKSGQTFVDEDLEKTPKVFDSPVGFSFFGGG